MEQYKNIKYSYSKYTKRYTIYTEHSLLLVDIFKKVYNKTLTDTILVKVNKRSFDVYEFFLLEFEYLLNKLKNQHPEKAIKLGGIFINELLEFIRNKTWISDRYTKPVLDIFDYNNIKKKMKFSIAEHQRSIFEKYEDVKRLANLRGFIIDAAPGTGKALKHGTPILTPSGWENIENIAIGDFVIGSDGLPVIVDGVYPQGYRKMYGMLIDNEYEDTYIENDKEHLWEIKYISRNKEYETVLTVKEIMKLLKDNIEVYIPKYTVKGKEYKKLEKIVNTGKYELCTCISVKSKDRLYITKDYILTHNTYMSLALGEALGYENFIILAPKNTIENVWVKSITKELYRKPQDYYIAGRDRYEQTRFFIMHYEYLEKLMNNKKLVKRLKRLKPFFIIDEFHNFNEIKSKRTNILLNFVEYMNFNDIVPLTGTSIKMTAREIIPLLYILDRKFPPVADKYKEIMTKYIDLFKLRFGLYREHIPKNVKSLPPINIQEYKINIPDSRRFLIDEINKKMSDYKQARIVEIYENMRIYESEFNSLLTIVEMNMINDNVKKKDIKDILNKYNKLVKEIRKASKNKSIYTVYDSIAECREIENEVIFKYLNQDEINKFKEIRSYVKYPELKVLGEALGRILLRSRIECYNELAKYIKYKDILTLTDKKCVIFSNYVQTCNIAYNKCKELGYNPIAVYDSHIKNLSEYVKKFNKLNNDINPLVATYKALSTGVPLLGGNIMILIDIPMRTYILDQAISRVWRMGQDKPVTVFMVKLDTGSLPNITERDHFILNLSQQNVEMLTDVKLPYEVPKQELKLEEEDDEVIEEIEEEIEDEIIKSMITDKYYLNTFTNNKETIVDNIKQFINKIKIKVD